MFDAMSILLSAFARRLRLRRPTKRIMSPAAIAKLPFFSCGSGGGGDGLSPFVKPKKALRKLKAASKTPSERIDEHDLEDGLDAGEPCVWQRTILLGQRCQPLEFAGAIHYDCEGKRLWEPRSPPTSPARSVQLGYVDRA